MRHLAVASLTLAAGLVTAAGPADAWIHDTDANKIDDRIEQVFSGGMNAAREDGISTGRLTIAVFDGQPLHYAIYVKYDHRPVANDSDRLRSLGLNVVRPYRYIDYIRAEATEAEIRAIAALDDVERIEAIPVFYALNHYGSRVLRARDAAGLRRAENYTLFPSVRGTYGYDGTGIVVAILDTGVNDAPDAVNPGYPGHESLRGKFLGGGNFYAGNPLFNTPATASENPQDHGGDTYHATHVAGTAVGTGGQDAFFAGMAPAARLVDCKVLSDAGVGFGAADGIEWCIYNRHNTWGLTGSDLQYAGIDVISMSLGCLGCSSDGTSADEAMVNAAADSGIVVVIATGNDNAQNQIADPAGAAKCISVGATFHQNTLRRDDDQVTDFSNEGPRADDGDGDHLDEMKPSVVAPGSNTVSANGDPTTDGGAYKALDGTSMATPHVSGICALIRQANPNLTPLEIRTILENTAEHFIPTVKATQPASDPFSVDRNYNPACGWGLVDAYAAVKEALNATNGVQVVQILPEARPSEGSVEIAWFTQREYAFQGFNVWRAVDAGGSPGTYTLLTGAPIAPAGDAIIQNDSNRTRYSYIDHPAPSYLGTTFWYRVDWLDAGGAAHAEPPVRVEYGDPPFLATVYYTIAHNAPDTDLTTFAGVSRVYNPGAPDFRRLVSNRAADEDSVVEVVPTSAATATTGSLEHWWTAHFVGPDGVGAYLPPSAANPWFLQVGEGHYVNRSGRITHFSMFVNDSPGSASGALYATNSALPAQTVEGRNTTVWIPEQGTATSVGTGGAEMARISAGSEPGTVRIVVDFPEVADGWKVSVNRGTSPEFSARTIVTPALLDVRGTHFEYEDHSVIPGLTYWYWLELRGPDDHIAMAGPVSASAPLDGNVTAVGFVGSAPFSARGYFHCTIGAEVGAGATVPVRLVVHDVQGRVVRRLLEGMRVRGQYEVAWDGRDESGRQVRPGLYFGTFQAGAVARTSKLAVAE